MDEELIELKTEESIDVDIETIEENVATIDLEQDVDIIETIEGIDVSTEEEIEIAVEEFIGWTGGDSTRHYSLAGRDEFDQHPIKAITGLRDELDSIEALQIVYSNDKGSADYYAWQDENVTAENRIGYFVSMCDDMRSIKICTDGNIFGVTVGSAAFIGGQDDIDRDYKYGLVAHSGIVRVRCELDISIGDYVISNDYGFARKTHDNCGYKVIAIHKIDGETYVLISLNAFIHQINTLGENVDAVETRMHAAETNITTAINVANEAHRLASALEKSNADTVQKVEESLGKFDEVVDSMDDLESFVESTNKIAVESKALADSAINTAATIRNEAVTEANKALADTIKLRDEFALMEEGITAVEDQISIIVRQNNEQGAAIAGVRTEVTDHDATINDLVSWQGATNTSMARIEQKADANGAYIHTLVANIDKYNVGAYSQAYGFTLQQAKEILEAGVIYVPLSNHTETYTDLTQTFTQKYYYTWDGEKWVDSGSPVVNFSNSYVTGNNNAPYWYIPGQSNIVNGEVTYEANTLYLWQSNNWRAVATLKGSSQNRTISQIRQDTNSIETSVTTLDGKYAGTKEWVDDNKSAIQATVTWKNENADSIATFMQEAGDNFASATQVAKIVDKDGNIDAASIVTAVNDAGSSVVIEADHIEFNGQKLDIKVDATNIEGTLVIGQLPTTVAEKSDIKTKTSELTNDSGFQNETGVVTIAQGTITADYIKALNLEVGNQIKMGTNATISWDKVTGRDDVATTGQVTTITRDEISTATIRANQVDVEGDLKAFGATIGGFTINDTSIYHTKTSYDDKTNDGVYLGTDGIGLGKGKFYVTKEGFLHAESGEFSGTINGGSININNNFIVNSDGHVSLNGSITWGTGASPTQVVYGRSNYTKPDNNTSWSSFPSTSTTEWHKTYSPSYDYCASYTYDGGKSWTDAILIRGKDGNNGATPYVGANNNWYVGNTDLGVRAKGEDGQDGKDGEDGLTPYIEDGWWCLDGVNLGVKAEGTDAEVTPENIFSVLTNDETLFGCFSNSENNDLYINATYIKTGVIESHMGASAWTKIDLDNGTIDCANNSNRLELDADGLAFSGSVFVPGASFLENSNILFSKSTTFGYDVTMNSSIEMNGGVVIRFNNINYNITRDSNGFLKATTAAS